MVFLQIRLSIIDSSTMGCYIERQCTEQAIECPQSNVLPACRVRALAPVEERCGGLNGLCRL